MKQLLYVYGHADVKVFHLAICGACGDPDRPTPLPMSFGTSDERDQWTTTHTAGTGHPVSAATEIRVITP